MGDDEIVRLDVYLLTRRGHPVAHVKVPVVDLPEFLHEAQQRDPSATYAAVIRAGFRLGLKHLRTSLLRGARLAEWDVTGQGQPR